MNVGNVKAMMQERIERLSALLTNERQARRDAQHTTLSMVCMYVCVYVCMYVC